MATGSRVCIIGSQGMLGRELVEACRADAADRPQECVGLDLPEIDIVNADTVSRVLAPLHPEVIINAAAYTDVDGSESHQDEAQAVNGTGPANLARFCQINGSRLVHVSTDYVFDGTKAAPYTPEDPVRPQSVYGRTKAEGERAVREILPDHVIVRTSWLFGRYGKNFVKTILKLAAERSELRVVTDQIGSPTFAPDLARVLTALGRSGLRGTYHFCNAGIVSWHEFAVEIVCLAGSQAHVLPMTTAELGRPAARPANSALSTESLTRDLGITPRPWRTALAECVEQLRASSEDRGSETLSVRG